MSVSVAAQANIVQPSNVGRGPLLVRFAQRSDLVLRQPTGTFGGLPRTSDPVAQGALVHAEVARDLRFRLVGLFDDPTAPSRNSGWLLLNMSGFHGRPKTVTSGLQGS